MDIALIILGLLFIVASMVFVLNPPEAWVKKAFKRPTSPAKVKDPSRKRTQKNV